MSTGHEDIIFNDTGCDPQKEDTVTVLVTGDFCPWRRIEEMCLRGGYADLYNEFLPYLLDKDVSITNLEGPLTNAVNPIRKSGEHIRLDPCCLKGIQHGGFDVVSLANNHILDQGEQGLYDTIQYCSEVRISCVGAGENISQASKPLYITVKGKTVAIIAIADYEFSIATDCRAGVNPLDAINNSYQIKEAREQSDFVIVIVHGGQEYSHFPSPHRKKLFRFFADSGATAVIGHHSHYVSGYELYHGVPLLYGLGHFLFDWERRAPEWYQGFFTKISFFAGKACEVTGVPYEQCYSRVGLSFLEQAAKRRFWAGLKERSKIIQNDDLLIQQWLAFCKQQSGQFIAQLCMPLKGGRFLARNSFLRKMMLGGKGKTAETLNLFRCESHREVMMTILEAEMNSGSDKQLKTWGGR